MEELLKHLGYTTPFMYAAVAYGLFHWLDENASDEAKAALAQTMSFKDYKREQIASALVEAFDRIYTYPLLRWRAFFRSLLFTTVVSAIYLFEAARKPWNWLSWDAWLLAMAFNSFSDYLSLFVIRPLLIRTGNKPVIGLTLGAVSGAAIVWAANTLRQTLLVFEICAFTYGLGPLSCMKTFYVVFINIPKGFGEKSFGELYFVWPAMAVFAWLPLFALGILIARLFTPLSWIVGRAQWVLKEGKEHPLKAIGYVAAAVVFLGTVAARALFSA